MDTFTLLEKKLRDSVSKRFRKPTPVQQAVIPEILNGENVLVMSETGSGKTESCLIPLFNNWVKHEPTAISMLYITPLKSLNRDLYKRILSWSQELEFDVSVRHGDTTQYERKMQAENPPNLMIVTPETLQAILTGSRMRDALKNIRYVVVDEIHELIESKRGVQLAVALERLKNLIREENREIQLVGLSATVGSPEKVSEFLSGSSKKCKIIDTVNVKKTKIMVDYPKPKKEYQKDASKIFVSKDSIARIREIKKTINKNRSTLIFTNTREFAEVLSSRMKLLYPKLGVDTHHSSLAKNMRIETENNFKDGKLKALISTSSLELGIDIGTIDTVVQYMSPRQVSKLLQRIGRAGHRMNMVSEGLLIATDDDDCFETTVVAKEAVNGNIEASKIYPKSYDVLSHQIVGMSLEKYNIPMDYVYETIKKAYPFRNLKEREFFETCKLLQKLGFVWMNIDKETGKKVLRRSKKAFTHYFDNLSTIPDVRNYQIFDNVSNRAVGTLDAEFVALHANPGTTIITKGQGWRVIEVMHDKVIVEPADSLDASVPAWEGELIPVPFKVAQGVGKLKGTIEEFIRNGSDKETVSEWLINNYPVTIKNAEKMYSVIKKQIKHGIVPTEKRLLIEYGKSGEDIWMIIHTHFGSLINETIGRALSVLLTNQLGSVGLKTDPYRIKLKLRNLSDRAIAEQVFREMDYETLKGVLELSLKNTELFEWRFIHVAKRFGIISKDADFGKHYIKKLIEIYSGSVAYREALNEVVHEKLNIPGAGKAIEMMKEMEIVSRDGISPLGIAALGERFEIHATKRPEKEIFKMFKERIAETKIRLLCCQCGWAINHTIKRVPNDIQCKNCGARLVGVIRPWDAEKERIVKKYASRQELNDYEEKTYQRVMDTASLVISSGKKAVIALAGRGIGPQAASRIIVRMSSGDEFYREILEEERKFARNKRFWSG